MNHLCGNNDHSNIADIRMSVWLYLHQVSSDVFLGHEGGQQAHLKQHGKRERERESSVIFRDGCDRRYCGLLWHDSA
jgi:hypothetical protein